VPTQNHHETLTEILNRKTAKIPLSVGEQYELRGLYISAIVKITKLEETIGRYKNSLEEISKLTQELLTENEQMRRELAFAKRVN
jgi:TolA-binding protein